jgi:hypothetical protein
MIELKLWRLAQLFILVACAAATAQAQTGNQTNSAGQAPPAAAPPAATTQPGNRTSADETFELNITERRITERNFEASTSVETGEGSPHGLMLRVGVAVRADEINVLLRNVRGRVRFRASLERVLERLNLRRTTDAVP